MRKKEARRALQGNPGPHRTKKLKHYLALQKHSLRAYRTLLFEACLTTTVEGAKQLASDLTSAGVPTGHAAELVTQSLRGPDGGRPLATNRTGANALLSALCEINAAQAREDAEEDVEMKAAYFYNWCDLQKVTTRHAAELQSRLREQGISFGRPVHAARFTRDEIIRRFKDGEVDADTEAAIRAIACLPLEEAEEGASYIQNQTKQTNQ